MRIISIFLLMLGCSFAHAKQPSVSIQVNNDSPLPVSITVSDRNLTPLHLTKNLITPNSHENIGKGEGVNGHIDIEFYLNLNNEKTYAATSLQHYMFDSMGSERLVSIPLFSSQEYYCDIWPKLDKKTSETKLILDIQNCKKRD